MYILITVSQIIGILTLYCFIDKNNTVIVSQIKEVHTCYCFTDKGSTYLLLFHR